MSTSTVEPTTGEQVASAALPARAGLGELLAPVRGRLVVAGVLQALGAVAAVAPFVAVAELGRVLLDTPGEGVHTPRQCSSDPTAADIEQHGRLDSAYASDERS